MNIYSRCKATLNKIITVLNIFDIPRLTREISCDIESQLTLKCSMYKMFFKNYISIKTNSTSGSTEPKVEVMFFLI